jgi:hypothetical protein
MDGCELPGGVILKVEPSDPFHKKRRMTTQNNVAHAEGKGRSQPKNVSGPKNGDSRHPDKPYQQQIALGQCQGKVDNHNDADDEPKDDDDNDDDLDDFFASIE